MVLMYQPRKSVLQRQKHLKQQSERKWRCDNGRRDSGSGADHPCCLYDGIEIAMKVGSGGIAAMQKAIDFLKGMLDYEKSLGKTSMRKLLLKGGDLQVLQFNTEEDMKKG